jgi:hypothetical protein
MNLGTYKGDSMTVYDAYMDMDSEIVSSVKKIKAATIQALYKTPIRWTQNAWATYHYQGLSNKQVLCFCLDGAAQSIYLKKRSARATQKYRRVISKLVEAIRTLYPNAEALRQSGGDRSIVLAWNDNHLRTIEEVRAVVKLAKV